MPFTFPPCKPFINSRKFICLLAVTALLTSSLLSSVAVLNPRLFVKEKGWLTGEKVLVCTSAGLRWVSVQSLEQSDHHHDDEHPRFNTHCPVFKLYDNNPQQLEGDYKLVRQLQFIGYLGDYLSLYTPTSQRLFLLAPKHSPPLPFVSLFHF